MDQETYTCQACGFVIATELRTRHDRHYCDQARERREFIRRAAIAYSAMGSSSPWAKARSDWDAKPEDC